MAKATKRLPDKFAVLVIHPSMSPAYDAGDTVYVDLKARVMPGRDYIFLTSRTGGKANGILASLVGMTRTHWQVRFYGKGDKPELLERARYRHAARVYSVMRGETTPEMKVKRANKRR